MSDQPCHLVRVDRRATFSSATLRVDALTRLQAAFRSGSWFGDRWTRRRFREAALHELGADAAGGLVLLGPGLGFEPPPPFGERFEPVPLARGLDESTEQLKVLSGSKPTRQERLRRFLLIAGAFIVILGAAALVVGYARGLPAKLLPIVGGMAVLIAVLVNVVLWLQRLGGRWFLVPAGIAIVGGLRRKRGEITRLTRQDAFAFLRLVHTGKTVILMLEIVARSGKRYRCSVSEREALGFLAAWQSPQPPPAVELLRELAGAEPPRAPGAHE